MTFHPDRIGGCIVLTFCCGYGLLALEIPTTTTQLGSAFTARTMPLALAVIGVVLSLALVLFPDKSARTTDASRSGPELLNWRKAMAFIVLMSLYGLSIRPAGFIVTTVVFLAMGFWLLGERKVITLLVLPAVVATLLWYLLSELLGVYIAPGPAVWDRYD
ncbi:MAG: tripartite tricarboxylate transporter TctB family protein [bacterium]